MIIEMRDGVLKEFHTLGILMLFADFLLKWAD